MSSWIGRRTFVSAGMGAIAAAQQTPPDVSPFSASLTIDASRPLGTISPLIYGQFLEHMEPEEHVIYGSLHDPESPLSDSMGLRKDAIRATRELMAPTVRWPGGNFADVYHWEDGIGARAKRPVKKNLQRKEIETHQFGTDEFLTWCEAAGTEPYININLGTGTLDEALRWLEYCNGGPDTPQGRWRAANGRTEPYKVRYWGVGNENWGHWEAGFMPADQYSAKLFDWGTAMKQADPSIKILGVGSRAGGDPEWDRTVLRKNVRLIDYLTIHLYGRSNDRTSGAEYEAAVFSSAYFERRIGDMLKVIGEFAAERRGLEPIRVSMDEWHIRHHRSAGGPLDLPSLRNLQDAVETAGILNGMARLSPGCGMANYVFLSRGRGNGMFLVSGDRLLKTVMYHLFQQYTRWIVGESLGIEVDSPVTDPPPPLMIDADLARGYQARNIPYLDCVACGGDRQSSPASTRGVETAPSSGLSV